MDSLASSVQLENLKCAQCKNSLSYFPVKISCENGENICGRCSIPEETLGKYIHNEAYETATAFLQFACRYKNEGCAKIMFPGEVPNHEKSCPFQVIACPVKASTICDWMGSLPKLLQHCQKQHLDLFLKNEEFEMDLSESHELENFVEYDDMLLVTTRKFSFTSNRYLFSVSGFEADVKNIYYNISFKSKNKSVQLDGNATLFSESLEDTNEIFLGSLKKQTDESEHSPIFAKITLSRGDEHEQISSVKKLNENMLSQLKCSDCSEYVLPPIRCSDGQVYCSECKVEVVKNETRNFALDNLASLLDYPCRYRKNDCPFVSKADRMKKHQQFCLKGVYPCPLNEYLDCTWKGLGENFVVHLKQKHSDIIITNSSDITENSVEFTKKKTSNSSVGPYPKTGTKCSSSLAAKRSKEHNVDQSASFSASETAEPHPKKSRRMDFPCNSAVEKSPFAQCPETFSKNKPLAVSITPPTSNTDSADKKEKAFFEKCYIIEFLNYFFRLNFAIKDKTYCWVVQMIGNSNQKFKYELEIVDKKGRGRKLLRKQPCSPLTTKKEVYMKKQYCCFIPAEDLRYFLSPQKDLTFKVTLCK